MGTIMVGGRCVGSDFPPLVIAEIGINHGGSIEIAKSMVDAASRSGVDVVKHQTHIPDDEMSPSARCVTPSNSDVNIYDLIKSCALSEQDELTLKEYVESKGMIFLSTPFGREAANRLRDMGVSAYKIGSGEMNNFPLVRYIASFGKPLIISTGMNSMQDIHRLVSMLNSMNTEFALMHTTSLYPTPCNLVRLGAMVDMMNCFPSVPIGLSDHTINNYACYSAIALGACIVERHFTDSMNRSGPDILCSMDELAARDLVDASRQIWQMRGGKKELLAEEMVTADFAFATCVAIKDLKAGDFFSEDNLWVKRPFVKDSIRAEFYYDVLGKRAAVNVGKGTHVTAHMIEGF